MSNLVSYGFTPRGASKGTKGDQKKVSLTVSQETWARWKKVEERLCVYGDIQLAAVLREALAAAVEQLETEASQLEATVAPSGKGGKVK
jgi:hypothetical protein